MLVIQAASSSVTLRLFVESLQHPVADRDLRFVYLFGDSNVPHETSGAALRVRLPRGYLFFLAWFTNVLSLKIILAKKPDVFHVHTPSTALGLVWVLRGLAKRNVRLVYTARGGFDEGRTWIVRALWNVVDPLRWALWDSVGVVNPTLEAKAKKYHRNRAVTLLNLGAASPNLSINEPSRSEVTKASDISVIRLAWVGRFSRDKRPADFLRLVSLLRDKHGVPVEGIMMGSGDLMDRARVDTRQRDDVVQMGWVQCPQEFLADCDLFISTSVREGYGLVPVESAMVGTPSIAYKTFGTSKSVPEVGGCLVPAGDLDSLAEAVLEWARLSDSAKKALRDDVQMRARKLVSSVNLMAEMTVLYRSRA